MTELAIISGKTQNITLTENFPRVKGVVMVKKNQAPTVLLRIQVILQTVLGKPSQVTEEIETTEHMSLAHMNS